MRAADLLGTPVRDRDGRRRGMVLDVRTRPEREVRRSGTVLVVDGFLVGSRRWRLFGYERRREHGPALLQALVSVINRNTRYVRHDQVDVEDDETLRLRVSWNDLPDASTSGP